MQDFITRMAGVINKRTVEHLILAGAFDTFGNTRRGMMNVYERMIDSAVKQNKDAISGQMSLFDFVSEEDKQSLEMRVPDIQEFEKEDLLEREKEVLGVYVTGHPLDEYTGMWEKHISARISGYFFASHDGIAYVGVPTMTFSSYFAAQSSMRCRCVKSNTPSLGSHVLQVDSAILITFMPASRIILKSVSMRS